MEWPVCILHEADCVERISFKKWFLSLFYLLSLSSAFLYVMSFLSPAYAEGKLTVVALFYAVVIVVFLYTLVLRIYWLGIRLTSYEAYKNESENLMQQWMLWGSRKTGIRSHCLFSPDVIDMEATLKGGVSDVHTDQPLKLRKNKIKKHTEEEIYYELLSSSREVISDLESHSDFEIFFISNVNAISYSLFKTCWLKCGFREERIINYTFINPGLEEVLYESIDNEKTNKVFIVLAFNLDVDGESRDESTEFASLSVFAKDDDSMKSPIMVFRPMACTDESIKCSLLKMMTYQPELLSSSMVSYSGVDPDDILLITNELKNTSLLLSKKWDFSTQDLSVIFGRLNKKHSWLSLSYLSDLCLETKKHQLMVAVSCSGYVFTLIAPQLVNTNKE